jgi:acetyltransferase
MFGLGGIHTEVLKDVTFALAPLSYAEALEMVQGIRSFPLLRGVRGQQGLSVDILVEYLVRLSRLVTDCPQIREIDLNPIKGTADTLYVVDARILIA